MVSSAAMDEKRAVLIISYYYLPEVRAASYRIHAWAKYLPKFGWEPIILTRYPDGARSGLAYEYPAGLIQEMDEMIKCRVYRAASKQSFENIWNLRARLTAKNNASIIDVCIRRMASFVLRNFLLIPDEKAGWYRSAYRLGLSIIRRHAVQAILSTGGPWTNFRIASRLSRITGVPWIADYRDPWTQRTTLRIRREYVIWFLISRIYERIITRTASGFIHIAEPLRAGLQEMIHRPVHLIPNGFDPEKFRERLQYLPSKKVFTLSFVGTLHTNTKTDVFFEGFHKFVCEHHVSSEMCRIQFVGDILGHKAALQRYSGFHEISGFITFKPPVSQGEANEVMCRSHILLSFPLDMEGCFPAKTYEYLASGRPILVTPDGRYRGVIRHVLSQTGGGVILNSPEQIASWLGMKYQEFRSTGSVTSKTDHSSIWKYSREKQVQILAQVLENTILHTG